MKTLALQIAGGRRVNTARRASSNGVAVGYVIVVGRAHQTSASRIFLAGVGTIDPKSAKSGNTARDSLV